MRGGPSPGGPPTARKTSSAPPEAVAGSAPPGVSGTLTSVRLDVWLHVACIFPTRSRAKAACEGGKVDVNGARAKPHREIKPGDAVEITTGGARRRSLVVRGLAERSIPRAQARTLYEDTTPPLSPEEIEARRLERILAPSRSPERPDRRNQREGRDRKRWSGI